MKLFGTGDIAEKTGLSTRQVGQLVHNGRLPKPTAVIHAGNKEIPVWTAPALRSFIGRKDLPVSARVATRGRRRSR